MSRQNIRGVIFDLGETLIALPREIDDELYIANIANVSEERVDFLSQQICLNEPGLTSGLFVDRICNQLEITDPARRSDIAAAVDRSVSESLIQNDALRCLRVLRERGLKLCLISNTNPISWDRLRHHKLDGCFDNVIFSCDVGLSKPDPRIFEMAFSNLGLAPDEVCAVGDKVRTIVLGVAHLGTAKVLVERRATQTVLSERLVVDAVVPNLDALCDLELLTGQK